MIDLTRQYALYNRKYFGNKLPKDVVVEWSERLPMTCVAISHAHGVVACDEDVCREGCNESFIRLDPELQKRDCFAELTLLHEMAHIKSLLGDRRFATHGPVWQAEMLRLAKLGAFNHIW